MPSAVLQKLSAFLPGADAISGRLQWVGQMTVGGFENAISMIHTPQQGHIVIDFCDLCRPGEDASESASLISELDP